MDLERTTLRSAVTADALPPGRPAPRRPCLVVTSSPRAELVGAVLEVVGDEFVIGRDPTAGLHLDDPGVSRRHARIAARPDGGHAVADLGSLNGTYVNGVRIRIAPLAEGDRIQIGTSTALRWSLRAEADASDVRLRQALAAGGLATWEWRAGEDALSISPEGERLLALAPGAGQAGWDSVHPDDRAALARALAACAGGAGPLRAEVRAGPPGLADRWVSLRGEALVDAATGRPGRVTGTLEEITARKTAERELRRQASLFESLSDGAVLLDADGRIADWNPAAAALFGWTRDEAIGRALEDVVRPVEGRAFADALAEGVRTAGRCTRSSRMLARDGRVREIEVVAVPLAGAAGGALGTIVLHRDVGERKGLEARLLLAERLGALGTMASGMAHEVNNPLSFLVSNLEYAQASLDAIAAGDRERLAQTRGALEDAHVGAERIHAFVRDLRRFSRGEPGGDPRPMDLNDAVEFGVRVMANQVRHRARIVKRLAPAARVLGSETKLGQVVVNLLVNAVHAIDEGNAAANEIRVTTRAEAGAVVLEVADTGRGVPAELQERIFEPFFTTRPLGEGTGLGLAICHAIVAGAGGTIAVESEPGRGALFRVTLPALAPCVRLVTPPPPPATVPVRRRVLVVDDDPLAAVGLRRMLDRDHDVTVAASGAEALGLLQAGARFDAILCDVMMPDMNGAELVRRLGAAHPDQARRTVLVSGGAFGDQTERALDALPNLKLAKPCTPGELARAIAQVAGEPPGPTPPEPA